MDTDTYLIQYSLYKTYRGIIYPFTILRLTFKGLLFVNTRSVKLTWIFAISNIKIKCASRCMLISFNKVVCALKKVYSPWPSPLDRAHGNILNKLQFPIVKEYEYELSVFIGCTAVIRVLKLFSTAY